MSETTENKEQLTEDVTEQVTQNSEEASESTLNEQTEEQVELSIEEQYKQQIAELEAKLAEEENRFLRLRADYDNLRRRSQLDREAGEKYRAQSLLTDLLPVLDNFERALQVEVTSEDAISLNKGIDMVYRTLVEAINKEGLEVIPAEGVQFDPNVHQAVMQEADSEKESGIVLTRTSKRI